MSASRETVLVAMSGGVDSSVAAALLAEQGHAVIGVFMRNGVPSVEGRSHRQGCCGIEDAADARRVADQLDVPFYALNLEDDFSALIDDFVGAYARGRTPNPCIECNRRFKMGALLTLARKLGADAVATGHYARIVDHAGRRAVAPGRDLDKDQSYVLFPLDQETLAHTRFPVGHLRKSEVRAEAERLGLRVAHKPESMEICFVPTGDYRDVVRARSEETLVPGPIVDQGGREIGRHDGTELFTIGQRRGLPGGQGAPLYVTAIEPESRTVRVGPREALLRRAFVIDDPVFSGSAPLTPGARLEGRIRIRAHHEPVPAAVTAAADGTLCCDPAEPLSAVTPGQAAVLYGDDVVLCGGWISETGVNPDATWDV